MLSTGRTFLFRCPHTVNSHLIVQLPPTDVHLRRARHGLAPNITPLRPIQVLSKIILLTRTSESAPSKQTINSVSDI